MNQQQKINLSNQKLELIKDASEIHCYHCGSYQFTSAGKNNKGKQRYRCKDCKRKFIENAQLQNRELPLSEDVWSAKALGLKIQKHNKQDKIIFADIESLWMKDAIKKYISYIIAINYSSWTVFQHVWILKKFADFITNYSFVQNFEQIDRQIIIDYLEYLSSKKLSVNTRRCRLSCIQSFLKQGMLNRWFKPQPYLIREGDYPKKEKLQPRYIPEEVIFQLNQHLSVLPEPVMRMVLVIQECGLRIGELCQLPVNCLKQDTKGGWYIQFIRWKMKSETTLPISTELAAVIQEQQKYIKEYLGDKFEYLFCGREARKDFFPKPSVMSRESFIKFLKDLAVQFNIKDNSGKLWNFQSHQFRHTVGTQMINNGVPQHIIQRYLGHTSPTMTSVYAHIHDKTLKKEITKYHDSRVINVAGEMVKSSTPELDNDLDLHLLKKKVLAQALPNGSCARPIVLGECPHANACLTCGDFRTTLEFLDQHKSQLEETEKLVKNAEENGWKRHAEMNTKVKGNLQKIIATLESGNRDIVSGGNA